MIALIVAVAVVAVVAMLALALASVAIADAADARTDLARLVAHVNTMAASPARTAELERLTGADLLSLPPRVATMISAWRAVRRG